ncbi:NUDIX domain-containing protein [Patescibacteria group bacterium]|nr:NUDIX domain-containing protein [Patescibacteria group bacterium]MBU4511822.1 NUDIX domain-containing protein [Patescibacteria group bacterium]MCG2692730.1 NUDIX domain-containing protein [Candidatus Parcubacteria bacterium]
MAEQKSGNAVSAFIMKHGKFMLLKRCNPPIQWCPPCGRARKAESLVDAVVRESKEETNLDVKVLMPITSWFGKHGGEILCSISFLCEYVSGEVKLSDEHNEFKWLTVEEMIQGEMTHDIKDFVRAREIKQLFDAGKIE